MTAASPLDKRIKKTCSFVPLPILDLVQRASSSIRGRRRESQRRKKEQSSPSQRVQVKQLDPSDPYSPWFRTGKPPQTYLSGKTARRDQESVGLVTLLSRTRQT